MEEKTVVVSQGGLAVIRELFIILYIVNIFYQFIVIFHIVCACAGVCLSLYVCVSMCSYMLPCKFEVWQEVWL